MRRKHLLHAVTVAAIGAAMLAIGGAAQAATPHIVGVPILPSQVTLATSDRCIQLEQQFDAVKEEHASNPHLPLAQSQRDKGSYLCNADVDDEGEATLEKALRLLGVEPEPLP